MFRQVFNSDNLLWRIVASGVDFVGLSLFWALLCLPVITIAPATAALYYATVKVFRQGADDGFTLMWKQFRENLKTGVAASLLCLPVIFIIFYGYAVMLIHAQTSTGAVMFVFYYLLLIIPIGTMIYLFAIMGRFKDRLMAMVKNAFFLAMRHLPSTIIIVLLVVQLIMAVIKNWAVLFVAPVGGALLSSFFLEKIFMKYLSLEERAAMRGKTVAEIEEEERERAEFLEKKKKDKEKEAARRFK